MIDELNRRGLIGHWAMHGNARNDVDGLLGTVTGATLTTDRQGNANRAYRFLGNDTTYIAGSHNIAIANQSPYSLIIRSKGQATTGQEVLFAARGGAGMIAYSILSNDTPALYFTTTAGQLRLTRPPNTLSRPYGWTTACIIFDGVNDINQNIWIGNNLYKTSIIVDSTLSAETIANNKYIIGGREVNLLHFNGDIGEVLLYNRAISDSEYLNILRSI